MKKLILMLSLSAFGTFLISSCSKDDDKGKASVMIVHASPNSPAVDLLVDDKVKASGLAYPDNTAYLDVEEGNRNLKINATGTATTVIEEDASLQKDKHYSVFAIDSLSRIDALILTDDLTAPAAGKSHLRFVHLSPNAPAIDVAVAGGDVLFGNYEFKDNSAFTPLPVGNYDLEVRLAGTLVVVLALPNVTLAEGKIYTVFAKGFVGGAPGQELGAEIITNN